MYQCTICGEKFTSEQAVADHVSRKHSDEERE
jgi:hypothetical protein